jgi:hypothetical protein
MEITVTKTITKIISRCYHTCPYFVTSMDGMECGHPFFDNSNHFENMIISHPDCDTGFPKQCPLLKK